MQVIPVLAILHSTFFFFIVINVYDTVTSIMSRADLGGPTDPFKKFNFKYAECIQYSCITPIIICVIVMTHIKDTARDVNLLEMPTPTSVL